MPREIDQIVERLTAVIPGICVQQVPATHPADDDGLWFIGPPGREREVQIESIDGNGPFLIETNVGGQRFNVRNVPEAVAIIRMLLT